MMYNSTLIQCVLHAGRHVSSHFVRSWLIKKTVFGVGDNVLRQELTFRKILFFLDSELKY
jgi:hypothetical protein